MTNIYDNKTFFDKYAEMSRSKDGLKGAGEWHALQKMLPDFNGKKVLDLGCGYGWHCQYAIQHGVVEVLGIDSSEKMLTRAQELNHDPRITYQVGDITKIDALAGTYDVILSSLVFHYIADFTDLVVKMNQKLALGGNLLFSVEHPIFTAQGKQDWYYNEAGEPLHWPVDSYFSERQIESVFLGETVSKQHRTMTTYLNTLLQHGFQIQEIIEPEPDPTMLTGAMLDELRRPMMLLIAAVKVAEI